MKTFFVLLAVAGVSCVSTFPVETGKYDNADSGALCQGSKAWRARNVCDPNINSGYCIRAVDGPFVITEINSSDVCPNAMNVAILDTILPTEHLANAKEKFPAPSWELKGRPMTRTMVHKVELKIPEGQSLFIGTDGFNNKYDASCCYVTWNGYRP